MVRGRDDVCNRINDRSDSTGLGANKVFRQVRHDRRNLRRIVVRIIYGVQQRCRQTRYRTAMTQPTW